MRTLVICVLALTMLGCARQVWDVKAYDLQGHEIYSGQLITGGPSGGMETQDGRKVSIVNATVIMEEVK